MKTANTPDAKFKIGQFVRIKDEDLRNNYPEFTGLILAYVGYWADTKQGYGILMEGGFCTDFREEELEPVDNLVELHSMMVYASIAIHNGKDNLRQLMQYAHHIKFNPDK